MATCGHRDTGSGAMDATNGWPATGCASGTASTGSPTTGWSAADIGNGTPVIGSAALLTGTTTACRTAPTRIPTTRIGADAVHTCACVSSALAARSGSDISIQS